MSGRSDGQSGRRASPDSSLAVRPSDRPTDVPRSGRLLALDWGSRRIGLALSDPTQTIAQPLTTLTRRSGRRFPLRAFRDQVEAHQPAGIVVGLPLDPDGTEGATAGLARELGALVGGTTGLPVVYCDERMTTSRARRAVDEMGATTRGQEGRLDALAATVLLQAFLDGRHA